MQIRKEKYSKSFFFSVLLHVIVLIVLIVSFDFSAKMPVLENSAKNTEIINARIIASMPKSTRAVVSPKPALPPIMKPNPPKPIFPDPIKPVAPPKPPEKQVIAILDKKQQKLRQDKIAQQLLSEIKKQTDKRKKITKQKELVAAFEKEMKQLTAQSQQMQQEQKKIAGARQQQVRGEVNKYKALILQTISQNWLVPSTVNKRLQAELLIRVAPGGMVLDVQIIKSSGDDSLDRSARTAVLKSSPLPVPSDSDAFETFRQFVLKVKPENILTSESW